MNTTPSWFQAIIVFFTANGEDTERGDVPGWVLITLMTAALVAAIWALAADSLTGLFEQAMARFAGM